MSAEMAGFLTGILLIVLACLIMVARNETATSRVRRRVMHGKMRAAWRPFVAGIGAFAGLLIVVTSPMTLIVGVPVAGIAYLFVRQQLHSRELARYERLLPYTLDAVARSMRSGAGLLVAIEEAGNDIDGVVARDMAKIARRVRHGNNLTDALHDWMQERPLTSVRLAATSMVLALKTGAAQAEVIDRVVLTVRQSLNATASARTHATQARASMWALTLMPVLFTGPMLIFDGATRSFLLHSYAGIAVLSCGLLLDSLGALWMSRLTKRALS